MEDNKIYIDELTFTEPLELDYEEVFGMFDSYHSQDCCEYHELDFENSKQDFEMTKELLSKIDKIEIYGEKGMGITLFFYDGDKRHGIFIPGRGSNNGYYSDELILVVDYYGKELRYDITEYQDY